jgi:hypothetical protein
MATRFTLRSTVNVLGQGKVGTIRWPEGNVERVSFIQALFAKLNVAAFPFITALSLTRHASDFVIRNNCDVSGAAVSVASVLFNARESFLRPSRRPDLRG